VVESKGAATLACSLCVDEAFSVRDDDGIASHRIRATLTLTESEMEESSIGAIYGLRAHDQCDDLDYDLLHILADHSTS
jgi:predicted transcriptional regulator